jgi:hypothetical protein
MSYTEYMRRKAAAAPKIIDTTVRTDASSITMRRRLAANQEFMLTTRQGVINNVSDPSGTGTTSTIKSTTMTTKLSGGRIPDASFFTSYLGGQAISKDGGLFQKAQRYTMNSNDAGSLTPCVTIDEPAPYITNGLLITNVNANINQLSASGTILTIGYLPYTISGRTKTIAPKSGGSIIVSGALSTISLTGFTNTAGTVVATTTSTAGIQNGTVIIISGGTASAGNKGTFTVTSFVLNTSITYTNASGVTESATATATFSSPNNGTFTIISVVNPTQVTVTNANAITDAVPTGITTISLYSTGTYAANTVPRIASYRVYDLETCIQPSTEPHNQNELGPSVFVGDTIALNRSIGITTSNIRHINGTYLGVNKGDNVPTASVMCPRVNHTHPTNVPHNNYQARPLKGRGGIPVFTVPSADDARKVGAALRNIPYVEKHHGNDLNVNPKQLFRKYQIPTGPAHLKINDPTHYPVS